MAENPFYDRTVDVEDACRRLERDGYCVLEGLLKEDWCAYLDAKARAVMDPNAGYCKRAGALNDIPELAPLCEHPAVLDIIAHFLGKPFYIANNVNMFWTQPGGPGGQQHCDWPSWEMPVPFPPWPVHIQLMWMLTDFTADNGATRVVPGSHWRCRAPAPEGEFTGEIPVVGPRGAVFIWNGNVWHRNAPSTSPDRHRMGVGPNYIPRWLHRPEDGWPLLRRDIYEGFLPPLQQLLERAVEPA